MKPIFIGVAIMLVYQLNAQNAVALSKPTGDVDMKTFNLYNPFENVDSAINVAVQKAKKEGKHVFLQMGGNWCIWCARYNQFTTSDKQIDSLMKANYILVHVNYSKENKNKKVQEKYEFPARFGFPVFVVLDAKGRRLHTQNSSYLEKDKNYSKEKVMEFLESWAPEALNGAKYTWLN